MAVDQLTWWTWEQFNDKVDELCPLESTRIFGQMCDASTSIWPRADGSSVYYRNQIRQAILDLCNFIPEFSKNNESIYYPQDFAPDGYAHVGALPPFAAMESAWYYSVDRQRRFPVVKIPWEDRFQMTTRQLTDTLNNQYSVLTAASMTALAMTATLNVLRNAGRQHVGLMAVSPKHDKFYVYPHVCGEYVFSLFWDGQKLDYRDQEMVPFEEEAAKAAADYTQAQFAKYIERDYQRSGILMADYGIKRSNIFTRTKEKGIP